MTLLRVALEQLACPDCRSPLQYDQDKEASLRCRGCRRCFAIHEGIPHLFARHPGGMLVERTRELYDSIAEEYDEQSIPIHVAAHYLRKRVAFVQALMPRGRLLDVGCGTGRLAGRLAACGYSVTGVDISHGMLRRMARLTPAAPVAAYGFALPFPDGTFDGALTVATLHHIADPQQVARTIQEMVRVVRSGGVVLIWDHNPSNPYWPLLMRRVIQDIGIERLVPLGEIIAALRPLPVRELRVWRLGFVPDFTPPPLVGLAAALERILEALPLVRRVAAHNVVAAVKV